MAVAGGALFISSFSATSLSHSFLVFFAFIGPLLITMPIMIAVIALSWYYFEVIKPKSKKAKEERELVSEEQAY